MRERQPFKVEITKTISGTITVYARTPEEAEMLAETEINVDDVLDVDDVYLDYHGAYPAEDTDETIGETDEFDGKESQRTTRSE